MKAAAHTTAAVTRVLVTLAGTRGNGLTWVVVGDEMVLRMLVVLLLLLLLLLQSVDVVQHKHCVIL